MTITFHNTSTNSVEENTTGIVMNLQARLADDSNFDEGITYSIGTDTLTGGADFDLFTIDITTGALKFNAGQFPSSLDYESPKDDGGDNNYDVIVTATNTNTNDTAIHALTITVTDDPFDEINSAITGYASTYELSSLYGYNGFTLLGENDDDYSGVSVSNAGDVNADGIDDILIGAIRADINYGNNVDSDEGAAYVVFGNSDGFDATIDLGSLDSKQGFKILGLNLEGKIGLVVSNAGDINGDGNDDLLIAAIDQNPSAGYVVFGAPGLSSFELSSLDGSNGFAWRETNIRHGVSVSNAGDVNGDGYDDLVMWTYEYDAYVVFGASRFDASSIDIDTYVDGNTGFKVTGIIGDHFDNKTVSAAGDVNGDGYGDLIIGSYSANSEDGISYVIFGAGGGFSASGIDTSALDGNHGFIIYGPNGDGGEAGWSVSSAGDVNDDGNDDLIIGAPGQDGETGAAYIVFGGDNFTASGIDLAALDGTNGFAIYGIDEDDEAGYSVSGAGDFDGDGYDDLIIGAYRAGPNGSYSGQTYLVFGGATLGSVINLSSLDGSNGFILNGINGGDNSGYSVSGAGDINGDDYDDIIIGSPKASQNGSYSGESYVIFGGPRLTSNGPLVFNNPNEISVEENTTGIVMNLQARLADDSNFDEGITYSIGTDTLTGGADFDLFTIDITTGALKFNAGQFPSSLDYESPKDDGGDNNYDVIVTATNTNTNDTAIHALTITVTDDPFDEINSAITGYASTYELSNLYEHIGFTLLGENKKDYSGVSVSNAGDVNADGIDDILIGANQADIDYGSDDDSDEGAAYVVFGSTAGFDATIELSSLDGTHGFKILGLNLEDEFGKAVSNAGDINGDGNDDLIIGYDAIEDLVSGSNPSGAYVIFGVPGLSSIDLSSLDGSNGFAVSEDPSDGIYVSNAGNVNGDDYDDFIIWTNVNEAYVVFGASHFDTGNIDVATYIDDSSNGFRVTNIESDDAWDDKTVSAAGDVNGDGYDDVIIGSRTANSLDGISYVVFGASGGFSASSIDTSALDGNNGFIIYGKGGDNGQAGKSVSAAGDLDGDGYGDLIIGAPKQDEQGASYVVFGRDSFTASGVDLAALDDTIGFTIYGIEVDDDDEDESGYSVSSAGDFDGDGYDDLIISAYRADPNGSSSGQSYLVFGGGHLGSDIYLSSLDGSNGFILNGVTEDDNSGNSVSSAGDINGDGYDDLIIGASAAPKDNRIGETYVIFGGPRLTDNFPHTITSGGTGRVTEGGVIANIALGDLGVEDPEFKIDTDFTWTVESGPAYGAASVGSDGGWMYTLDDDLDAVQSLGNYDTLKDSFTVSAADSDYNAVTTVTITIIGTDNPNEDPRVLPYESSYDLASLNGLNGFTLNGFGYYSYSGFSVSNAGDINHDGIDDIIIGAHWAEPNGIDRVGETYVVFGNSDGFDATIELTSLDGTQGFIIQGLGEKDQFGFSVANAGDVNGDGCDDIIIGSPHYDTDIIETYVIFGKDGLSSIDLNNLDGSNGFVIDGGTLRSEEISVSSAGKINDDNFDDLIIGLEDGESFVVFGGDSFTASGINLSALDGSTNGFKLTGIDGDDLLAVSTAGDINSDGCDDIIIGSYGASSDDGVTYVVFGDDGGFGAAGFNVSSLDGTNGFIINGNSDEDGEFGRSVAAAGDLNGDGWDDIIIGADEALNKQGDDSGAAYVLFGKSEGVAFDSVINLSSLDGSNGFVINGIEGGDDAGISVSGIGDFDDDGYNDLLIGAYKADPNKDKAGQSYLIFGGTHFGAYINLSALDGTNGFKINGIDVDDRSGYSVSGAGDVNADGYADLLIGANRADPNSTQSGETYVIFGGPRNSSNLPHSLFAVEAPKDVINLDNSSKKASGTLGVIDAEGKLEADFTWAVTADPTYGTVSVVNGDWTFTLNTTLDAVKNLGDGSALTDSFTLRASDTAHNADETITVTILNPVDGPADHSTLPRANLLDNQITPTPGDDILEYGLEDDIVSALTGDDYADVGDGNDTIGGGPGNDTLEGGSGADYLFGWTGDDVIYGGTAEALSSDFDDNVIWAGAGDDTVIGGAGHDTLGGGNDDDSVTGGRGDDLMFGGFGNDTVLGDEGFDTLYGGWGNDLMNGGAHSDILYSGDGTDTILGGSGNDTLVGGSGDDQLSGGIGADTFVFTLASDNDHITDFDLSEDILDLSGAGISNLDTLTSAAEDTSDGLLLTLGGTTTLLFTGLSVSDLGTMAISFA